MALHHARLPLRLLLFSSLHPTALPTHLCNNIMAPPESPFSNLDVWCDWDGDFNAPVEVTVSVEVSTTSQRLYTITTN